METVKSKTKNNQKIIGIKSRPSWFKLKYLKEIGETGILRKEMERRLASINQQKNKAAMKPVPAT